MKKIAITIVLLVSLMQAASIELKLIGAIPDTGQLYIGLYDNGDYFPVPGREVKKVSLTPKSDTVKGSFKNLPVGESYAFYIFQDLDSSGHLTIAPTGFPKEPFAFSNHTKMGVQGFLRSAFILKQDIEMELFLLYKGDKK